MAQHQSLKFRTKLYLGYASVLFLMILLTSMVYVNLSKLEKDRERVNHSYEVIETVQKCGALLVDMETGVRGFLVSGKEAFLEPYQKGLKAFETTWISGKGQALNTPSQTRRWDDLKRKKEAWINTVAKPEIEMRREVREGEAALDNFKEISSRSVGKQIFDRLGNHLRQLSNKFVHADDHKGEDLVTKISMDLLNQETAERGFLLTGLGVYLEAFNNGITRFDDHFEHLAKINVIDKGIRIDEIVEIKTLVDKWHEKTAFPGIEARREVDKYPTRLEDVAAILEGGTGKRLMDEMRGIILEVVDQEREWLFTRAQTTATTSQMTIMITIIGTFLATIIGGLVGHFIVSGIARQLGTEPHHLEVLSGKIARGDLSMDLGADKRQASGVYAATISMVENLQAVVKQAQAVSRGDFEQQIEIRSTQDQLGTALSRMTRALSDSFEINESEKHLRAGQAKLDERL